MIQDGEAVTPYDVDRSTPPGGRKQMAARLVRAVLAAICGAVLLTACDSTSENQGADTGSLPPGTIPALVPVSYPDAPRELTATEKLMMYEPGPYAGDRFDKDAVLDAVLTMQPDTADEWQRAILSLIHGGYAEAVKKTIEFDPNIGEIAPGPEENPTGEQQAVGTNHFALVLDASGSMGERSGPGTRMDEAKKALEDFVDALPDNSTVSLRVYGHKGGNDDAGKAESCAATEVIYNGKADPGGFTAALAPIRPTGWTPLAASITAVATDIPAKTTDSIAYIVTDGLETCDGNPVQAAKDLAGSGVEPIVNVIGFQADNADQAALEAIAEAGNGTFTPASDAEELDDYLDAEYQKLMDAWDRWKRHELDRISAEGRQNMDEATTLGRTLMDTSIEEWDHAQALIDALYKADKLDYDTKSALWNHFYDRKTLLWNYGYDTKTENWNDAYNEKTANWNQVYETGTTRWSEYYSKKSK